jgi:cytochrome b
MQPRQFFEDGIARTLVRLAVLSLIVGIVLSALGISPANMIERLTLIARRLSDLGFGVAERAFGYFVLGAIIVVPIWIIVRLVRLAGWRSDHSGTDKA